MKLGLIGCGSIGSFLLRAVNREKCLEGYRFSSILDLESRGLHLEALASEFGCPWTADFGSFLQSDIDLVVEAANPSAAQRYAPAILESGRHLLLMSVGALQETDFLQRLQSLCRQRRLLVCVPSGAIGGLDALRSAIEDRVDIVRLTTRKPPAALEPHAGPHDHLPNLDNLSGPVVIFEGSASEAIKRYPRNINVSIALSLAGLGPDATQVRIVADPSVRCNIHEIEVKGRFGELRMRLENLPMEGNPKTSFLAALSAIAALRRFDSFVRGGVTLV